MKNLVRTLRTQQNLAQGQLAEAMGVSRQTINSIETERYTPSLPRPVIPARHRVLPLARLISVVAARISGPPVPGAGRSAWIS
jgi:putative transcriptional regulator